MKRVLVSILMLVAALALSSSAMARGGAGHNPATKKLEDAFKAALYFRSVSPDGCYPSAPQLAKDIASRKQGLRTGVASGPGSVAPPEHRLRPQAGLGLQPHPHGPARLVRPLRPQFSPGQHQGAGPPRAAQRSGTERPGTRRLTDQQQLPDAQQQRAPAPRERLPRRPVPDRRRHDLLARPGPDGEGIYPHSYERLGAQRGFHISEVLFDPTIASTTPRNITLQTVCARGPCPRTPHRTRPSSSAPARPSPPPPAARRAST